MVDLSHLNTLRIPAKAQNLIEVNSESDLKNLPAKDILFLGQGANILFKNDFPGTVAKINLPDRHPLGETEDFVEIELGAGENWHAFVTWTVSQNLSGIENMAQIPGTVGAAAIGNIAAYGQNQEDAFVALRAIDLPTQKKQVFTKKDMNFGYRESIFKTRLPKYLVTSVIYKLSKTAHLELSYHAARHASLLPTLQQMAQEPYTIRDVYNAIIKIRTEKLPDPQKIGTAGSFFKNPVVPKPLFLHLKSQISNLQAYPSQKLQYTDESEWLDQAETVKVAAGRLLDELGWKGKRIGNVGTFPQHALTLIAYPGATGQEVWEFAENMRADVKTNFQIDLEYEVVIL